MMPSYFRATVAGVVFLCALLLSSAAWAQVRDPDELVAAYVREYQANKGHSSAFQDLVQVLTHHTDYPASDLKKLLDALERVALTAEPQRLRAEATVALSIPGKRQAANPVTTFPRLQRVYRGSTDPVVRSVVVQALGDLAERRDGALFLESIAKQERADFPDAQKQALTSLMDMDEEGRSVLKRLHDTNAVRDPEAKQTLVFLAKQGYRPSNPRRQEP